MIPITLTLEGLYSYQERQTIDFKSLTQTGLFGIFGSVGSGKSSILEAMSFALFGRTERMHARDNRSYNMMNLKSNRLYLEFIFLNHENKKFKINREFRRNSKNFNDIVNREAVLYEEKNEEWVPLPDLDIEKILGLSYDNFKRTIIIPQGQFKEFLELGAADRTRMMKEIFNLQKYDLANNTRSLLSENKSNLDQIEGKLSGFENVSKQKVDELNELYNQREEAFKVQQKNHEFIEENFRKLNDLRQESKSYQSNLKLLDHMKNQAVENENLEKEIEQYEFLYKTFHALIHRQNELIEQRLKLNHSKSEIQKKYHSIESTIETLEKKKKEIQPKFDALDKEKEKVNDLEIILNLKDHFQKIEELKPRLQKGESVINENKEQLKSLRENSKKLVEEEIELKKQRIDSKIIFELSTWYQTDENLKEDLKKIQKQIQEIQSKINDYREELKTLEIDSENFSKEYESTLKSFKNKITELESQKSHLELEQKLSEYSDQLHDGKACPLCGSLEHPNKLSSKDLIQEIENKIQQIKLVNQQIDHLNQKKMNFERIQDLIKIHEDDLKSKNEELKNKQTEISEFHKTFQWKEFDANNRVAFELKKKHFQEIENQYETKRKELEIAQGKIEKQLEFIEKCEKTFDQLKTEFRDYQSQFKANELHLKQLSFKDFQNKTADEIDENLTELKIFNEKIEKEFKEIENNLNNSQLEFTASKTQLNALNEQLEELQIMKNKVDMKIDEELKLNELVNIDFVKNILNQELDVLALRKKINDFKVQLKTLENTIETQKEKLKDFNLSDEEFAEKENEFQNSKQELSQSNKRLIELNTELNRLKNSLKEKSEILEQKLSLEKRHENLRSLAELFKADGFVQYVSSIYLRQLCDQANLRFHRMTKNQLSLQLNDKLDFEVVDYLNEGRSRSVKTLSGGQSFQVSLSLALALAESVQSQSLSDKNFFFIDEGFGTQDSDAVNIVFETLSQLQKENRMVGIISHVSELQEKIPMSLHIENDAERGSLIRPSWE